MGWQVVSGSMTFGPFCGTRAPDDIETDGHEATVIFHSDDSGENVGWRLTYTTIGSTCAAPEAPPHALLTPVQSEYSFKDHILFTCSTGFTLLQVLRLI
ncbi:Mannan-binding lectin serine protease 1 [Dissostichus eleginoides]|uniref:Mannan-binding lectin serine protease 1 n=1 Tax=Dissostichus eleginoides TaxID=100907 RepID=A0AAD9FGE6_DISEL|nr:Mannan-binding lectin serine protease 1 [Dissostichus eleginoides]